MNEPSTESTQLGELRSILGSSSKSIEESLLKTVRERPQVLVDILFPVILPAIRRSIATLLQSMVEELNHVLEKSLSFRSFRWRLEALRTGRPYAEIALLRSVRFEVVDIFLVHRHTGLLILHAASPKSRLQEATAISTLLSAIQDYIRESFHLSDNHDLNRLQVGEYSMWIEQGPHALIAARTRGPAPKKFHDRLQSLIEMIHRERSANLESFVGDPSPFLRYRTALEDFLRFNSRESTPSRKSRRITQGLLALPLIALIAWTGWSLYHRHARKLLVERLSTTPGVLVTDAFRSDGKTVVEGFRDPLSVIDHDPEKVDLRLRPYLSLDPLIASRRATTILAPPPGASVSLTEDSILNIQGIAPYSWLKKVREGFSQVPGAKEINIEGFQTTEDREFQSERTQIEHQPVYFSSGSSAIRGENQTILSLLVPSLRHLDELARGTDRVLQVEVVGDVDSTGSDFRNERLALERAEVIIEHLRRQGIPAQMKSGLSPIEPKAPKLDFLRRQASLQVKAVTI